LLLGTSSWTGDGWVGSFYPAGSQAADFLPYYAQRFPTVEIDTTFYRIPMAKTVEQWRDRTPKGFIFAAKVPQVVTHQKVLVDTESDLQAFVGVMDLEFAEYPQMFRWFQFPTALVVFVAHADSLDSGAVYVYDRKQCVWLWVDFNDQNYGGYSPSEFARGGGEADRKFKMADSRGDS
jgi:hypothetical protein